MPYVIINGRRQYVPEKVTEGKIRDIGGIRKDRTLIRRTRTGNYPVTPGSTIPVNEGDVFIDAPKRVKGAGF